MEENLGLFKTRLRCPQEGEVGGVTSGLAEVSDWGDPPRGEGEGRAEALLHDEARGGRRARYLFKQNPGVEVQGEALTGSLSSQAVSAGRKELPDRPLTCWVASGR